MGTMQRFREEMRRLGNHPDRQIIRDLTLMADKGRHRSRDIVDLIQATVLSSRTRPENRLPLCYLMDSIIKNFREPYRDLFQPYIVAMSCRTYENGSTKDRQCILKLLRTWKEGAIYDYTVVDPIEAFIDRVGKGSSHMDDGGRRDTVEYRSRTPPAPVPSPPSWRYDAPPSYASDRPGDKRKSPYPDPERQKRHHPSPPHDMVRARYSDRSRSRSRSRSPPRPPLPRSPPPPRRAERSRSPPRRLSPRERDGYGVVDGARRDVRQPVLVVPEPSPYAPRPPLDAIPAPLPPPPPVSAPAPLPVTSAPSPAPVPPGPPPIVRDVNFILAVEKEMRSLLDGMCQELGESEKLSIEELAKRNPPAAEQLKQAAEATVTALFQAEAQQRAMQAALDIPFEPGFDVLTRATELAEILSSRVVAAGSPPAPHVAGIMGAATTTATQLAGMIPLLIAHQQQEAERRAQAQAVVAAAAAAATASQAGTAPGVPAQISSPTGPVALPVPPGFTADALNRKQLSVILRLHEGVLCHEDAMRFFDEASQRAHFDANHHRALVYRTGVSTTGGKRKSRPWMLPAKEWVRELRPMESAAREVRRAEEEAARAVKTEEENRTQLVPVYDDPGGSCGLCSEPLDQFWDNDTAQWMYKGAVRVVISDGQLTRLEEGQAPPPGTKLLVVHRVCFDAADSREAAQLLVVRRASSIGTTLSEAMDDVPEEGGS